MALLLKPNGTRREVKPAGRSFTLEELYALTECDIVQTIGLPDGRTLVMDEEGKYRKPPLPVNEEATRLGRIAGIVPWDVIIGTVYSLLVEALSAEAAIDEAEDVDLDQWGKSWSGMEADREEFVR